MHRSCLVLAAVLCCQIACAVSTDNGTYSMTILSVSIGASDTLQDAVFAQGTELCFNCEDVHEEGLSCDNVGACLEWEVDGTGLGPERCMPNSLPGSATLDIVPVDCANAPELDSDSRTFEWVETARLSVTAQDYWTDLVRRGVAEGSARTVPAWSDDWTHPEGAAWTLVADQPYSLYVQVHDDLSRPVAWDARNGSFDIMASGSGSMAGRTGNPYASITLSPGTSGTLLYTLDDQEWDVATLETAAVDEAASLEIVTGFAAFSGEDPGYDSPVAARAVVRTADGTPLYGAPVTWSIEAGSVLLSTVATEEAGLEPPPLPGSDHILISDVCQPPEGQPSQHTATLVASLGPLSTSADLVWAIPPGDPSTFVPAPDCAELGTQPTTGSENDSEVPSDSDGCSCNQGSTHTPVGVALLLLALFRRRTA